MSEAKCEAGWGESLSTRGLIGRKDCHPTPPLISFATTLPLQGRVKEDGLPRRGSALNLSPQDGKPCANKGEPG